MDNVSKSFVRSLFRTVDRRVESQAYTLFVFGSRAQSTSIVLASFTNPARRSIVNASVKTYVALKHSVFQFMRFLAQSPAIDLPGSFAEASCHSDASSHNSVTTSLLP